MDGARFGIDNGIAGVGELMWLFLNFVAGGIEVEFVGEWPGGHDFADGEAAGFE